MLRLFILFALSAHALFAQWQQAYDQLLNQYDQGQYQAMVDGDQQALQLAIDEFGDCSEPHAYTLQILNLAYLQTGAFDLGIQSGKNEVACFLSLDMPDLAAQGMDILALQYQYNNLPDSAIAWREKLKAQTGDALTFLSFDNRYQLGTLYYSQNKPDKAKPEFEYIYQYAPQLPDAADIYLQATFDLASLLALEGNTALGSETMLELVTILSDNGLTDLPLYPRAYYYLGKWEEDPARSNQYLDSAITYLEPYGDEFAEQLEDSKKKQAQNYVALGESDKAVSTGSQSLITRANAAANFYLEGNLETAADQYLTIFADSEWKDVSTDSKVQIINNACLPLLKLGKNRECLELINGLEGENVPESKRPALLVNKGKALFGQGDLQSANAAFGEVMTLDPDAQTLQSVLVFYLVSNQFELAEEAADQWLSSSAEPRAWYYATLARISNGNLSGAEEAALNSVSDLGALSESLQLQALLTASEVFLQTARFDKADSLLSLAADRASGGNDPEMQANILVSRARILTDRGDYANAESSFLEAEKLASKIGGPFYADILNSTGLYYQQLGIEQYALDHYRRALKYYPSTSSGYSTALQNLATVYESRDQLDSALLLMLESQQIDRRILGEQHPKYAMTLQNIASIYKKQEKFKESSDYYARALQIDSTVYGTNSLSYANKLFNLAMLDQDMQNYQRAAARVDQVLSIRRDLLGPLHPDYAYTLYGKGVIEHTSENWEAADASFNEMLDIYQYQIDEIFPILSEKEKTSFYHKIEKVLNAYRDFAVEYAEINPDVVKRLYNLQIRNKAIIMNATRQLRQRLVESASPEVRRVYQDWMEAKSQINQSLNLTSEQRAKRGVSIDALQEQANSLEKELFRSMAGFETKSPTWEDIKARLPEGTAAIETIRIKKNIANDSVVYAFLVLRPDRDQPQLVVNPRGNLLEGKEYSRYKNSTLYKVANPQSYQVYWADIHPALEGISQIYFSADGIYNKVSLNGMLKSQDTYLIDDYYVRYVTNSSEITGENSEFELKEPLMVGDPHFGDALLASTETAGSRERGFKIVPLPGTSKEIESISSMMKSERQVEPEIFTNRLAAERTIKQKLAQKGLIHFATHGFFIEGQESSDDDDLQQNPLRRSGLLLAGSQKAFDGQHILPVNDETGEDGVLTAFEIINQDLSATDLVILSACETALGEIRNGEGVYGLQRAFKVAGANHLLMSMWKVDDQATQELMTNFYSRLLSGKSIHDSFYEAQSQIREKYPAPYYWASFILIGN